MRARISLLLTTSAFWLLVTTVMQTASFLAALRAHPPLPLVFSPAAGPAVPAGYHLTEVKRVALSSMDCGGEQHAGAETHFELWLPPLSAPGSAPMSAGKFLRIVDRVAAALPLDEASEAKVFFGPRGGAAALHRVVDVVANADRLVVALEAEGTRCRALERRTSPVRAALAACCAGGDDRTAASTAGERCCG
jgi:hypothetical protein